MMVTNQKFFKNFSLRDLQGPILSGILVGTSYIPLPPWALLFCYIPLWLHLFTKAKTWKEAFQAAWVTQFIFTLFAFHWIAYVAHEFGQFPWFLAIITLLLFSAFMHIYVAIVAAVMFELRNRFHWSLVKSLFAFALATSLAERIWPSIFPWNLGYPIYYAKIPAYNWADVIGFLGLSTIVLLVNAWIAWIWSQRAHRGTVQRHSLILVLFLIAFTITGFFHGLTWNEFDRKFRVSIIQANIGNMDKIYAEKGAANFQESILNKFLDLSTQAVQASPSTELLVWPETAFPDYMDPFNAQSRYPLLLGQGLNRLGKTLLTGAYSKDAPGERHPRQSYNGLFLVDTAGRSMDVAYRKTHLLAFGEYLPLSERFPIILEWLPFIANFGRGPGPTILTYPHPEGDIRIGTQICYEGLFPEFSRGLAKKHATVLANVTNDSWFGKHFEPQQHLYMTLARSIEVRRPLIRSTNTGVSTVVLANGQILEKSPLHKEWFGSYDISFRKDAPTTAYVLWGHWEWILVLGAFVALIVKGMLDAKSRRT